jgi:hypothetical protein
MLLLRQSNNTRNNSDPHERQGLVVVIRAVVSPACRSLPFDSNELFVKVIHPPKKNKASLFLKALRVSEIKKLSTPT